MLHFLGDLMRPILFEVTTMFWGVKNKPCYQLLNRLCNKIFHITKCIQFLGANNVCIICQWSENSSESVYVSTRIRIMTVSSHVMGEWDSSICKMPWTQRRPQYHQPLKSESGSHYKSVWEWIFHVGNGRTCRTGCRNSITCLVAVVKWMHTHP